MLISLFRKLLRDQNSHSVSEQLKILLKSHLNSNQLTKFSNSIELRTNRLFQSKSLITTSGNQILNSLLSFMTHLQMSWKLMKNLIQRLELLLLMRTSQELLVLLLPKLLFKITENILRLILRELMAQMVKFHVL